MRSALILAGGASDRFGRPKPFEILRGKPILRWIAEAVRPVTDELIVSVADASAEQRSAAILPQAQFVRDRHKSRGPIEGILRGFEAARGDAVLVVPCDAPLLRSALLRLLLERLEGHEAAVPRLGVFDPIRAGYQRTAVRRELERSPDGIASPSALVDRLDTVFVDFPELRSADPHLLSFLDVNRPEDIGRVERAIDSKLDV